ncbi:Arm DNA-binding domain-containing protein [Pseudomonas sp. 210_17 TE3656]
MPPSSSTATHPPEGWGLPSGVDINGNQLRAALMYEGQPRREPLRKSPRSTRRQSHMRITRLAEIREGRFDYAAHFPESSWLKARIEEQSQPEKRTVAEGVNRWLRSTLGGHCVKYLIR